RLEHAMRVVRVVRAEPRIIMLPRFRRRDVRLDVRDVVRAAHADEAAGFEIDLSVLRRERLDEHGDVVRVAGDDLHEALVDALHFLVDPARVRLPESEFRSLREETLRTPDAIVVLRFVVVAGWRAVDDDGGALERFFRRVGDAMPE